MNICLLISNVGHMNPITFTIEEANLLVKMIDLGLKSDQGGAVLATQSAIVLNKIGQAAPQQQPTPELVEGGVSDEDNSEENTEETTD